MLEAKIRMELQRSMMLAGLEYHHPEDSKRTDTGRPDILCINGAVVEVKKIDELIRKEPWFDPTKISNTQRRQLDYYCFGRVFLTFLAIGTTFGNPRRLWVIPWTDWVAMEYALQYKNPDKFRIQLSDLESFTEYEMTWGKGSLWTFPTDHPILKVAMPRHENEWQPISIRFLEDK